MIMTRGEAIAVLTMQKSMVTSGRACCKALDMAIEALSERTGEWILECDSEGEGDNLYRCSECGCHYGCQEYDKPNFCPNCGKQMLRKDDETE